MEKMKIGRILGILLLLSAVAFAVDIWDCTNLSYENTTYTLIANVYNQTPATSCFAFLADNITLDCNGYRIDQNLVPHPSPTTGILINGFNNATIKNCSLGAWGHAVNVTNSSVNISDTNGVKNNPYVNCLGGCLGDLTITNPKSASVKNSNFTAGISLLLNDTNQCNLLSFVNSSFSLYNTTSNLDGVTENFLLCNASNSNIANTAASTLVYWSDNLTFQNATFTEASFFYSKNILINNSISQTDFSFTSINHTNVTFSTFLGNTITMDNESTDNRFFNNFISYCAHAVADGCSPSQPFTITGNATNYFNTTRQIGTRKFSPGTEIGGNFYHGLISDDGYSETCADANIDGFCDLPIEFIEGGGNITCLGVPSCAAFPTQETCIDIGFGIFNPICMWDFSTCDGTCTPCADLSFDEGTCNAELGCSWAVGVCSGVCVDCATFPNSTSCNAQWGCAWTGEPHTCQLDNTCGGGSDPCTCADLLTQSECQNQTGCNWTINTTLTRADYLAYSNKYATSGGGSGFLGCFDGTPFGRCSTTHECELCTIMGLTHSEACCTTPRCGDGVCNGAETIDSCPTDCKSISEDVVKDVLDALSDIRLFYGLKYTLWLLIVLLLVAGSLYEFHEGRQQTGAIMLTAAGFLTLLVWNSIYLWG